MSALVPTTTAGQPVAEWQRTIEATLPEPSLRRIAWFTLAVIVLGVGGGFGWAAVAKLDSAVAAPGVIVAASKRKTISLLDSGLLRELVVREGDRVAAGQLLLRLDEVQARTGFEQADTQFWAARARAARLDAEAANARNLDPAADLRAVAAVQPLVAAATEAERRQFADRWQAFDGAVRVAAQKRAQQQEEATALAAQQASLRTRLALLQEELRGTETLLARGFATKIHALELRRNEAELQGALADVAGRLAGDRQAMAQTDAEIANLAQTRHADIARERSETLAAIADAEQRRRAAADLLGRREVRAPEAGTVTDIRFFTPGSSIAAGQPVLDIVPADDRLVIEGSVSPTDIEHVHVGQKVRLRLTAYKAHRVPVLSARLVYVGADRQLDPQSNPIFLVRAELDPGVLAGLPGVALYAGMPADLLILGGERSVLDFLLSPLREGMSRGMIEQ